MQEEVHQTLALRLSLVTGRQDNLRQGGPLLLGHLGQQHKKAATGGAAEGPWGEEGRRLGHQKRGSWDGGAAS